MTDPVRFENETRTISVGRHTATIDGLSGLRYADGEVEFDNDSAERYMSVQDQLVLLDRNDQAQFLKTTRMKLGLNQKQASMLTGGGHNAFSRYETGAAPPMAAVVNLFRLLDRHPEVLKEIAPDLGRMGKRGRPASR